MENLCCICGRKQRLFQDNFPLGENENYRICCKCKDNLFELFYSADKDINKFESAKAYFSNFLLQKNLDLFVEGFINKKIQESEKNNAEFKRKMDAQQKQAQERQEVLQSFLQTTGNHFEGYTIKKYIKVISSSISPRKGLMLEEICNMASSQLISSAISLGANGLIGVNFGFPTISYEYSYSIIVIATGTAVYVEKNN